MTDVLFRMTKGKDKTIQALLVHVPADSPAMCLSMDKDGHISPAHPELVTATTRPATPREYAPLMPLLAKQGYSDVRVRLRLHHNDKAIRAGEKAVTSIPAAAAEGASIERLAGLIQALVDQAVERKTDERMEAMRRAMTTAMSVGHH